MAKMFYSLPEAAQRLEKSEDEVRQMAQRGEITEFRDGDNLIFKVDQIDLLAGDDDGAGGGDDESMIPLADTGLGASGSGMSLADSAAGASGTGGISIFDADEVEEADPGAVTQISDLQGSGEALDAVSLESFGSGSGLMDLTRDAGDDTAAGMSGGVLDDIYSQPDAAGETVGETGLFEGAASAAELETAPAGGPGALPEAMDPKFSGLTGGLMLGALITCAAGIAMVLMAAIGFVPDQVTGFMDGNVLIMMGICAGVTGVLGLLGFVLGGKS